MDYQDSEFRDTILLEVFCAARAQMQGDLVRNVATLPRGSAQILQWTSSVGWHFDQIPHQEIFACAGGPVLLCSALPEDTR